MRTVTTRLLRIGHSPDPDDAFMFYALTQGQVAIPGCHVQHVLEDIQTLNERALRGELEITAISAHAYPFLADRYWILASGASMGDGYGTIVVARTARPLSSLHQQRIAIPGRLTTAALLLRLALEEFVPVEMPFDRIMSAVAAGTVEAGVLIHEGQLTYAAERLMKILDLGTWWQERTRLPVPLGVDAVRIDLGQVLAREVDRGLRTSIHYAFAHPDAAFGYALPFGRGLDRQQGEVFVRRYVNEYTEDMGDVGQAAL
ncbi:MAG: ABC transporter substrate-binding protein, partial [Elusimicrobia bacterium]|nr:ABC transporter substrate-binding protein [Elusimicrobiota bacterium]